MRSFFFAFLFIGLVANSYGQTTKILGVVSDSITGEPLPFVNIAFKHSTIGTTSDFSGRFSLETKLKYDTLIFSSLGYKALAIKIDKFKFQELEITLSPATITLGEVIIHYKGNPAEKILNRIIDNKVKNDWHNLDYLEYELYNKIQLDANNLTEDFRDRRIFKNFQFIFDYVDTSTINGKSYLPIFLTETLSDFYYRRKPFTEIENIKATQASGIKNESLSQFTGNMYQKINVYDNHIVLFEKNFVSPVSNFGINFYKYYLIDSAFVDNDWCYKIMYKPRRKQELTFTGDFWVADTSYAIKKIDMRIADDANINYINDMVIWLEFNKYDTLWLPTKEKSTIDFNVIEDNKKLLGFYGTKTATFRNFTVNKPRDDKFYNSPTKIIIQEEAMEKDETFWSLSRHDSLSKEERNVYQMIDSIKNVPVFKTYVDVIKTIYLGYYLWGNFEIGPYIKSYSYNQVEGHRFRFGGRTSNEFSTKIMFDAHVAYGTKDEIWKYGGGVLYMFSKRPRRSAGASYKYDIEQLGQSQNAFSEDHFLASIFRRNPLDKLSLVREYKAFYQHEYFTGFSNTLTLKHSTIYPAGFTVFQVQDPLNMLNYKEQTYITIPEIEFELHYAFDEKFLMGEFERVSLGSKYPMLDVKYNYRPKELFGGDYESQQLQVGVSHWFNVGSFGWSKYIVEGGKIWGKVPYPMLKIHSGNETFAFDETAFNTMNYFEFASDEYATFYYTHHFDGFFLNHIPLMRKLKWREVALIKGAIGTISDKNQTFSLFPEPLDQLSKPYMESAVGIENIFKVFRIDAFWRLSHLNNPDIRKFGILASVQFSF